MEVACDSGEAGARRRKDWGMKAMDASDHQCPVRQPCPGCPWRRDAHAEEIPNFSLKLAEGLAATSPDEQGMGPDSFAPQFACHQSKDGEEIVCAGWLAAVGEAHPMVRMAVLRGDLPEGALDHKPELHETYQEVIEKLRADEANR